MRRIVLAGCLLLNLAALAAAAGCARAPQPAAPRLAPALSAPQAQAARRPSRAGLSARVLMPAELPVGVLQAVTGPAQAACDEASRRRQIDFFNLHGNPVGLRLGEGDQAGYMLSFLGTAKTRTSLNVELRAAYGAGQLATVLNYSGPTTLSERLAPEPARAASLVRKGPAREAGVSFELITGLPGDGVAEAYSDYMDHLGQLLEGRYGAQRFAWDDAPIIFAVHQGEAVTGFVFCNEGNRLVLGERKYADVQSVAALDAEGEVRASYTLIGWNPKTAAPNQAPSYRVESDDRFGALVEFGKR